MNKPIFVSAMIFMAAATVGAQSASQASPYQGVSTPPPDDTIVTSSTPQAKPPAGRVAQTQAPQSQTQPQTQQYSDNSGDPDGGVVAPVQSTPAPNEPTLTARGYADPDGDIVHPRPLRPGEIEEGTTIRVELMDRLSTAMSERGEAFHSRVTFDVYQGDKVLIPAGTVIDGRVAEVSSGHPGGRGSMRLQPDTMTLPDGRRFQLRAELSGTQGSKTKVGSEGAVQPTSRLKRDSIEYGGAVAAGATTGAIVAGPMGALTGTLIGAGVVTAHLLISHPQATLEPGTTLVFTLSEPLQMSPDGADGN
jgi:hypothetical protein